LTSYVKCIEDSTNENIIFAGEIVRNTPPLKEVGEDRKYTMINLPQCGRRIWAGFL